MRELYARQLRTDSIFLVIPVTVIVTILISVIAYVVQGDANSVRAFSVLVANIAIPIASGHFAWTRAKRDQVELGGWVFIIAHLLIITLNYAQVSSVNGYLPYLYGFFIMVSSTVIKANTSFRIWVLSTFLMIGALVYRGEATFSSIFSLTPILLINFMLAVGSFITSVDWEMAVYSASESHVKAQRQRDQWYEAQEQLKRINARQEFLYNQLATSMAVGQRVTAILDIEKLLGQVAELIQKQLGFAYVGIFLLDESSSHLEIRTYSPIESIQPPKAVITLDDKHVIGLAAAHREHIAIPDVSQGNYNPHPYMLRNVRSEAGFPLVMGGRLLGVINIQSYAVETFDQNNLAMLQLLADQVAIAINNAILYREQQIRYRLTQTMSQIQQAISSTIELDTVLDLILENLSTIVSYNRAAVFIYRNGPLDMVASRGFPDHINFIQITPIDDNDVFTKIYETQKPLAIPDVKQYPTWKFLEDVPDTRAWLGVPMTIDNEVMGMLSLARDVAEPYNRDDIDLASTFAAQAAVALQNARLYNRLKRFNKDLEHQVEERTKELSDAYDRLTKLDQAKSDFIEVASHELRTPLTLLKGYSDMLRQDAGIKENSYYSQIVRGIYTGSVRMHEIVNDMLDVVRIDNEELNIFTESVNILNPLKLVHEKLEEALHDRKQTLHIEGFENIPSIEVDPDAIAKVLRHVIINAIKYTPDGGSITVKAKMYDPAETQHLSIPDDTAEGIHITVQDTGIGIDPKYQDIIFTKFYQTGEVALHSSGKVKFKGGGPGLGLAIASGIVRAHNGAIWVESEGYNEKTLPGSCFHIVLPLHQTPEAIPAAEQS